MKLKAIVVAAAVFAGGCGDDEEAAAPATVKAPAKAAGYTPVSDVTAHAAIGKDMALIREKLDEGDFAAAATIWSEGQSSKKGDGTARTLAGFVEDSPIAEHVESALKGGGSADARRQRVDKGMVAAIEVKVLDELDSAIEKVAAGETDPAEGAPHNVDEAWAFFDAEGQGLAATAEKRAADFKVEVSQPILAALREAQTAAKLGDRAALQRAREDARGAMNLVFALAVTKYANKGIEDKVARAEGEAFAWGLIGDLPARDLRTINAAFGPKAGFKSALKVRRTINDSLSELGLAAPVPAYAG